MIPLFTGDPPEPPQRPLGVLGPDFKNHCYNLHPSPIQLNSILI